LRSTQFPGRSRGKGNVQELFELVRRLVDIESVTGAEAACGAFLESRLRALGFAVERQEVTPGRANVFATLGWPEVVLSTHMDTVMPYFASSEDDEWIRGRGACDAKGSLACQMIAGERLMREGIRDFGLLFVVGEERQSDGARAANASPRGSRYVVVGEPTENRLVTATKGVLQLNLRARGRAAHSAYPELGESAIEKLLDALDRLRAMPLPGDPELGPTTMNIGMISGGVAANVIPENAAATVLFRTVDDCSALVEQIETLLDGRVECEFRRVAPASRLEVVEGFETAAVSFASDVAHLDRWGRPLLIGPGTILVAHTAEERVSKSELARAVELYQGLVRELKAPGRAEGATR
jgi:acetylornithine deacetylase